MLPTTSSAANGAGAPDARAVVTPELGPAVHSEQADRTAEQFEGLLWSSVLAPLSQSLGPLGDVLTSAMGTSAVHTTHDAFYQHLRALIELSDARDGRASDDPRS